MPFYCRSVESTVLFVVLALIRRPLAHAHKGIVGCCKVGDMHPQSFELEPSFRRGATLKINDLSKTLQ